MARPQCLTRIINSWKSWRQRKSEELEFYKTCKIASQDNINKLDDINRDNFMTILWFFMSTNIVYQVVNFSVFIESGKQVLLIYQWIVSVVVITMCAIYYKTNKKHKWIYEAMLILITLRNIEPFFDFQEKRVYQYDTYG